MCYQCISWSGRLLGIGRTGIGAGSALIALLIPKCPLCVAAWAWALAAFGVSFDRWDAIKLPLTAAFLTLAALMLGFRAKPLVKTLVVFGTGLCLSFKMAEGSNSFALVFALGSASSSCFALGCASICLACVERPRIATKLIVP